MTGQRSKWTAENNILRRLGILTPLESFFTTHIYTQWIVVE